MKKKKLVLMVVVSSLLVMTSFCKATIIMDATHHNGTLTAATAGAWYNTPSSVPVGWAETLTNSVYQAAYQFSMINSIYGGAVNNTGEIVHAGEAFTVNASLGGSAANKTATVEVWATQNANGTGLKTLMATVSRLEPTGIPTYTLYPVLGTQGTAAASSLAGYYVQVKLLGGGAYYDNIVVTSEIIPEPATMALLGLGGLLLRKKK